jgi:hypothetical protein
MVSESESITTLASFSSFNETLFQSIAPFREALDPA